MSALTFSPNIPNKIGDGIAVAGKNTLIMMTDEEWRAAIADEPIDAKIDGKKYFCVRVGNSGSKSLMLIGFTPMETFDSTEEASFGNEEGFTGCGIGLRGGNLYYPVDKGHNIIDYKISEEATEVIVILTISNNGAKKEIRFLCDGNESNSSDVSEHLNGDFLFPAICLFSLGQHITTIPIDQIIRRTREIDNLIKEYKEYQEQQQQQQNKNQIPLIPSVSTEINNQVISQLRQQINDDQRIVIQEKDKQIQEMRKSCEEMRKDLLKQLEDSRREFQREREISNKQLELERAENQQLRNLLQHQKIENSAMEIYYLKRESGQRREREETEFKVKEEPKEDEEEKPIQNNYNNKKNKNKNQSKK
jgi:hypothetical protein